MSEQFSNQCSTFIISSYTAGSGVLNVASTAAPWPQNPTFTIQLQNSVLTLLRVTAVNSATQWAVTVEANDMSTNSGTAVIGTILSAAALAQLKVDISGPAGGPPSGLVLLEQHTASSSAALNFTSWYSTDYDEYEIHLVGVVTSVSADCGFQFSTDGGATYDTGTNYTSVFNYAYLTGTSAAGGSGVTATWLFGGAAALVAHGSIEGVIFLKHPASTTLYKQMHGSVTNYWGGGASVQAESWMGTYLSLSAANAFRFIPSTGTLASGVVRIYGLKK